MQCYKKNEAFESIYFFVDDLSIKFNVEDVFIKGVDNKCYFAFLEHKEKNFTLGRTFWKRYKIEFYQNEKIILYSEDKLTIVKQEFFEKHNPLTYLDDMLWLFIRKLIKNL